MTRKRRSVQPATHPCAGRARLGLEGLEDRTLLSTASFPLAGTVASDLGFDPSKILVRFHSEAESGDAASIVPGAVIGKELSLVPGLHQVILPASVTVPDAIAAFQADPNVWYAEPSYNRSLATIPNDPNYNTLYGMPKISAPQAWDSATGTTGIVVAVIDTGADIAHPDLYKNIWLNQAEIPASRLANLSDTDADGRITFYDLNNAVNQGTGKITDLNANGRIDGGDVLTNMTKDGGGNDTGAGGWSDGVDQGSNGYIDDFVGWDTIGNDKTPNDGFGHGTHVSGTIGAVGNNGVGVVGVNWVSQIMQLRIFDNNGNYAGDADVIDMFEYAVANGAKISNNSWGGGGFSQAMKDAISAMGSAGHLFVAAAGNNGSNNDANPFYPATYGLLNIVSVAATDSNDNKASFSNYGATTVHLGAPGVDVNSTLPTTGSLMGTNYGYASGTSMASPHMVGATALLWSKHPNWSFRRVVRNILNNVDLVPSMSGKSITGGRLNIGKAIVNTPPEPIGGTGHDHVDPTLARRAGDSQPVRPGSISLTAQTNDTDTTDVVMSESSTKGAALARMSAHRIAAALSTDALTVDWTIPLG